MLDDRCISQHRHDVRVADRGQRDAEGVERIRHLFWEESGVRAEPAAQELAERVRLLDRLGAREGGDDASVRLAEQPFGLVQRALPGDLLEAAPPYAHDRIAHAVLRVQMRVRETALVAEPAVVDVGIVP